MLQQRMRRLVSGIIIFLACATPARADLTHGAELAAVYDAVLAGRFELAERSLANTCPPAPIEACRAMSVAILWWRIALNPENRTLDEAIERDAAAAIDAAAAWTRREPGRAEAWFYHAAAHAPLVQWRLMRGQRLTAVREASRVKSSLERALDLDPTLHDARFGIGVYRYYAGIAPAALRMLRWLLWLPGGDREEGLRLMEEARQRGQLLRGEADYQLHFAYLWYENQPERALELLQGLHARYPDNPLFLLRLAEVQRDYFDDYHASLSSWNTLLTRADGGELATAGVAAVHARLGLAETLDRMFRTDQVFDVLAPIVRAAPNDPPDGLARAYLQIAAAHDRLGDRQQAITAYEAARRHAPSGEPGARLRELAAEGLQEAPDRQSADAYRLSVDGLRALEQGRSREAVSLLARSIALEPDDAVAQYRYARALSDAGQVVNAIAVLESLAMAQPAAPSFVHASAIVDLAALIEASGDRTRAIDLYRQALEVRGGAPDARTAATRALERLAP